MAELLAVEGLTAGYGESIVLEDVALTIDHGDSLALLACMHKLLLAVYSVAKHRRPFEPKLSAEVPRA